MKKVMVLMGVFLLSFCLWAEWEDYELNTNIRNPEGTWGIIRANFDSTGRLYLSQSADIVYYTDNPFDPYPDYEILLDRELANGIQGISFDADDNVYLSGDNDPDGFIAKFDSDGNELWSHDDVDRVTGSTLLSTGEFLVTDFGGTFRLFDPEDGTLIDSHEVDGLANFVRDIVSTPDDTVFAIQSGAVMKVTGGDAGNLEGYTATDFGDAAYIDTSFQVRPSILYLEDQDVVVSGNADFDDQTDSRIFFQDADTGELVQTIETVFSSYLPAGLAEIEVDDTSYLFTTGFRGAMRVFSSPGPVEEYTIVEDIAQLQEQDQDDTVYRLDNQVALTFAMDFRNSKYIQDNTGGVLIDDDDGIIETEYNRYNGITSLYGTLGTWDGVLQFTPVHDPGAPTATEIEVEPVEIDNLEDLTHDNESMLVQVEGVTFQETGTFDTGENYTLEDATDTAVFRTHYFGADYIGLGIPEVEVDLVGVQIRFHDTIQLFARGTEDFDFEIEPKEAIPPFEKRWSVMAEEYDWLADDWGTHSAAMNPTTGNVLVAAWEESPGLKVLAHEDGLLKGELNTDGNDPRAVTVLPSGKIIATVNGATEIMVWEEEEIDGAAPEEVDHTGEISSGRTLAAVESENGEIIVMTGDARDADYLLYTYDGTSWTATEAVPNNHVEPSGGFGTTSLAVLEDGSFYAKWVWEYADGTEPWQEEDTCSFALYDENGDLVEEYMGFFDYADGWANLDNLLMSNVAIDDEGDRYIAVSNYEYTEEWNTHDYVGIWNLDTGEEVASLIDESLFINIAFQADGNVKLDIADLGEGTKFYVTTAVQNNHIALFTSHPEELTVEDWTLFEY